MSRSTKVFELLFSHEALFRRSAVTDIWARIEQPIVDIIIGNFKISENCSLEKILLQSQGNGEECDC